MTEEDFESYIERLNHYFTASTYHLVKNVLAPDSPTEVAFNDIATKMKAHFHAAPSEIVQRCLYNLWILRPGESIATYVTELKNELLEHGNFDHTLDCILHHHLVCGIGDEHWLRHVHTRKS